MQISKKNVISIILLLCELLPILFLMVLNIPDSNSSTMSLIGVIASICFIISIFAIWRVGRELNAFIYFIIFAYLFSFGQCFMAIFNQELKNSAFAISIGFFRNDTLVYSAVFVLISIMMTCIGFLLKYSSVEEKKEINIEIDEERYNLRVEKACRVGWIMLVIGIIPTFVVLFQEYRSMLALGYASTLVAATGTTKILSLIGGFFSSGLLLLFCYERKNRKIVYFIILAYFLAQVAGGSRIQVFRFAIVFLLLEDMYFQKMDRRNWGIVIMFIIIGSLGLSLLSSIRNSLFISSNRGELISSSLKSLWSNNFIVAAINEMGNTQIINTLVFDNCPNPMPFQYGFSFIKILWAVIPNFIGAAYTGYIGVDITFSPLYTLTTSGLGASYISEGYWNFGYFSLIYFVVFGALFGWLVTLFNKMCKGRKIDPGRFFLVIYAIYYVLFLVRSEALGFGRSFVYYAVFPYLCINIRRARRKVR